VQKAYTLKDHEFVITNDKFLTIEILRKKNLDLSYILHKLSNLDIVQMDIYKLFSGIKYFRIDFNETINEGDYIYLHEVINDAINKVHKLELKKPAVSAKDVSIDCNHSKEHAIMQINCNNQKGLLSYILNIFDNLGIDISSAKIHTKMNRVNDLFLIEKNGNFCHNTNKILKELMEI
jgi:[protein-PII] uridylyltransferase